jgi:hypothetical protein
MSGGSGGSVASWWGWSVGEWSMIGCAGGVLGDRGRCVVVVELQEVVGGGNQSPL